jgi:hypothetical protein
MVDARRERCIGAVSTEAGDGLMDLKERALELLILRERALQLLDKYRLINSPTVFRRSVLIDLLWLLEEEGKSALFE